MAQKLKPLLKINSMLCTIIYFSTDKKNTIKIASAFSSGSGLLFGSSNANASIPSSISVEFIKGRVNLNTKKKVISGEKVWERHLCGSKKFWEIKNCLWKRFTDGTQVQIPVESIIYTKEIILNDKETARCDGSFKHFTKYELSECDIS